jgi:uncharacterized protein
VPLSPSRGTLSGVMAAEEATEIHCYRCIYTWVPRRRPARMCPRCKSRLWNVPTIVRVKVGNGLGIGEVVGARRAEVLALLKQYGAKEVRVFGSVRRQEADETSDLDLLVDDLPGASLLDVAHLKVELRRILGRSVDLVEEDSLPWSMRPQVLAEAVPL